MTTNRTALLTNEGGLHARAAATLSKRTADFDSDITVRCDDRQANGASILQLLTLGAGRGAIVDVEASGHDAVAAVDTMTRVLETIE